MMRFFWWKNKKSESLTLYSEVNSEGKVVIRASRKLKKIGWGKGTTYNIGLKIGYEKNAIIALYPDRKDKAGMHVVKKTIETDFPAKLRWKTGSVVEVKVREREILIRKT